MRRFRISLSLQVVLFVACASPLAGADRVGAFLQTLEPEEDCAVVWVISDDRAEELWLEDLLSSAAWRRAVDSRPTLTIYAEKNPSFLLRFGVEETPLCLLLEADGVELGRVPRERSPQGISNRLSDLLTAASAYRQYGEESRAQDRDLASLFWLGYFHWTRGEHFKALRWFEECAARPCREKSSDCELKARALYRRGEYALEGGHSEKAAALFDRASKLTTSPGQAARCALARALSLRRLGQPERAIRTIEDWFESGSSSRIDDSLLFSLGYLYLDLGNRPMARKSFSACRKSFPASPYGRKSAHYLKEMDRTASKGRSTGPTL